MKNIPSSFVLLVAFLTFFIATNDAFSSSVSRARRQDVKGQRYAGAAQAGAIARPQSVRPLPSRPNVPSAFDGQYAPGRAPAAPQANAAAAAVAGSNRYPAAPNTAGQFPSKSQREQYLQDGGGDSADAEPPSYGGVQGTPGVDFPNYAQIPNTQFSCSGVPYEPGMYADEETQCQVYHVCFQGRKESFLCGIGTVFNQAILACDYWHSVECGLSKQFYSVNEELGKAGAEPGPGGAPPQQPQAQRAPQQPPRGPSYGPPRPSGPSFRPSQPPSGPAKPFGPSKGFGLSGAVPQAPYRPGMSPSGPQSKDESYNVGPSQVEYSPGGAGVEIESGNLQVQPQQQPHGASSAVAPTWPSPSSDVSAAAVAAGTNVRPSGGQAGHHELPPPVIAPAPNVRGSNFAQPKPVKSPFAPHVPQSKQPFSPSQRGRMQNVPVPRPATGPRMEEESFGQNQAQQQGGFDDTQQKIGY